MYHCLCSTCKEDQLLDDLDRAQEYFNEHADRGCEVEILNVELEVNELTTEPPRTASSTENAQPADE